MKQHVLVRFGKWREIIAQELPKDRDLYCTTTAMMLYAKGVAHSVLGEIEEADKARTAFREAKARVPDTRRVHNNIVPDLLAIAEQMLTGELEYRRGRFDTAFAHLRHAVVLDNALPYDEPWGWMQPTRHALGALLLEQGHLEGRGGLSRRPRLRRQAQPLLPASRERVEPARPARVPQPSRRHRGGAVDQGAARSRAGALRGAHREAA